MRQKLYALLGITVVLAGGAAACARPNAQQPSAGGGPGVPAAGRSFTEEQLQTYQRVRDELMQDPNVAPMLRQQEDIQAQALERYLDRQNAGMTAEEFVEIHRAVQADPTLLSRSGAPQPQGQTQTAASAQRPGGVVVAEPVEVRATVVAVDYPARLVTLRGPEGRTVTVRAPDEVQNLENVRIGDTVVARYVDSVAIAVEGPGGPPSAIQTQTDVRAGGGQSGIGRVNVERITAEVEAVDHDRRTLTVRGPRGNAVTFQVHPSVERFRNVQVGDQIVVQYTEAVALSLEKP